MFFCERSKNFWNVFLMRCKNFLPPGDTFLEIEIETIATFNSQVIATFSRRLFLYRPINFYRQLIPTKQILSPNLKKKFFGENNEVACWRRSLLLTSLPLVLRRCRRRQEENKKQKKHFWLRKIFKERSEWENIFVNFLIMIKGTITGVFVWV